MRILFALDWSEETCAAMRDVASLYDMCEAILAHAIGLGIFQSPLLANISTLQGYAEFREPMDQGGRQLPDHTVTLLPSEKATLSRNYELARPAALIVDQAQERPADLIVLGAVGRVA